jgi:hypothetical protein
MTKFIPILFLLVALAGARADSPAVCLRGRVTYTTTGGADPALPSPVTGDWFVATNGTGTGTNWADATNSLQGAITACASNNTVWISNGTYVGNFTIGGGVTARSKTGLPADVTLDGNASGRTITMAASSWIIGCTIYNGWPGVGANGGGINGGNASCCKVLYNYSDGQGGGAYASTLYSCIVYGNGAGNSGGGASGCTLKNCSVYGNNTFDTGGGGHGCNFINSISWGNTPDADAVSTNSYSCGVGFSGTGSTTNDPLFSGSDLQLQAGSPCRDTGQNGSWTTGAADIGGHQRIWPVGGTVDMGAWEYGAAYTILSTNISINGSGMGRIMGVVQ